MTAAAGLHVRAIGRTVTIIFFAACAVGAALGLGLTAAEAASKPAIKTSGISHTRTAGVTAVGGFVTNMTGRTQCAAIRIAALDDQARTVGEGVARAIDGDGRLTPHVGVRYSGTLALTPKQYREKASTYVMYVDSHHPC